jgi:hypothetical protein
MVYAKLYCELSYFLMFSWFMFAFIDRATISKIKKKVPDVDNILDDSVFRFVIAMFVVFAPITFPILVVMLLLED